MADEEEEDEEEEEEEEDENDNFLSLLFRQPDIFTCL